MCAVRTDLTTEDLDFELPPDLVAQRPAARRGDARLLVVQAGEPVPMQLGTVDELLVDHLRPGDLVIANDSRVLRARVRVHRPTGGAGELLLLEPEGATPASTGLAPNAPPPAAGTSRWLAMARPARRIKPGELLTTSEGASTVLAVERTGQQTWLVDIPVSPSCDVTSWLDRVGELPLPPYITDSGDTPDGRYQTVHARIDGSVAAPTAGLHLTEDLWQRTTDVAEVAHVTLHVGAGTFLPVDDGPLTAHVMHHERYEVPPATDLAVRRALEEGRRIVAIGTTATRTLEHVYADGAHSTAPTTGATNLFIVPGHRFSCVGAMLTNFHLPKSTLIALVMAFHGIEPTKAAYRTAVEARMRFFSYGDAMFLNGPPIRD